jgi:hypothetical protein
MTVREHQLEESSQKASASNHLQELDKLGCGFSLSVHQQPQLSHSQNIIKDHRFEQSVRAHKIQRKTSAKVLGSAAVSEGVCGPNLDPHEISQQLMEAAQWVAGRPLNEDELRDDD